MIVLTGFNPCQEYHNHSAMMSHECQGISNHWQLYCLFNIFIRPTLKKTSKLCISGLLWGESNNDWWIPLKNSSNAESVSMSWRHHAMVVGTAPDMRHIHLEHIKSKISASTIFVSHSIAMWYSGITKMILSTDNCCNMVRQFAVYYSDITRVSWPHNPIP